MCADCERKPAEAIAAARPFKNIDDMVRRVPELRKDELRMLAEIGALNSLRRPSAGRIMGNRTRVASSRSPIRRISRTRRNFAVIADDRAGAHPSRFLRHQPDHRLTPHASISRSDDRARSAGSLRIKASQARPNGASSRLRHLPPKARHRQRLPVPKPGRRNRNRQRHRRAGTIRRIPGNPSHAHRIY